MDTRKKRNIPAVGIFLTGAALAALTLFGAAEARAKHIDERIFIIPAGGVDDKILESIKEGLPDEMSITVSVRIWPRQEMPGTAYDPSRQQYDAERVIDHVYGRITLLRSMETALIVTEEDLYMPDMDFCFGIANAPRKTCIISLKRLRNEFYGLRPDEGLLLDRALKEAACELGHAWGLGDCADPRCVMYPADDVKGIDKKRGRFCHACRNKAHDRYYSPLFKGKLF